MLTINLTKLLRMGGGANGIALLKDVPIYYELWRNINGFPPEYYQVEKKEKKNKNELVLILCII
jgi:hypothetical protein